MGLKRWLKKGDKVLIISGNDKGATGSVLALKGDKVLVQGVNVRKRHLRRRDENSTSQIVEVERAIHISNVALCNDKGEKIKLRPEMGANQEKKLLVQEEGKEKLFRVIKKGKK